MRSIRLKLWSSLMLFVAFMLIILWLFQIVFLESFYTTMEKKQLLEKSSEIVALLEQQNSLEAMLQEVGFLETFSYTYNLVVEITDVQGNIVFQSSSNLEQQTPNMYRKSVMQIAQQVLLGETVQTTLVHPRFGTDNLVLGIPMYQRDSMTILGSFIVITPLSPVSDTANILKSQLVYISIILLIAASGIALMISQHLSKPIVQIQLAAKKIARGELDITSVTKSKDEIGQLSDAIAEMALELKKTDLLRKELIGNISHELRTPLSLIKGYAETLRDITGNIPEKREKQLDIIIHEADRLAALIKDTLNLSQLETGAQKTQIKPCELDALLATTKNQFMGLAERRKIALIIDAPTGIQVMGDMAQLEQVCVNLISNAFNHSNDESTIRINVRMLEEQVRIEVADQGCGIPQDEIDSIWERYYRIQQDNQKVTEGSGLGLAIVKTILDHHQSTVDVKSTVGVGTTIGFTLKRIIE